MCSPSDVAKPGTHWARALATGGCVSPVQGRLLIINANRTAVVRESGTKKIHASSHEIEQRSTYPQNDEVSYAICELV